MLALRFPQGAKMTPINQVFAKVVHFPLSNIRAVPTNLLDVVVGESAAILELLAGKDQALLVWGNALLILNLRLHIVDGVRGLHLQGDGLACEGLDETVELSRVSVNFRNRGKSFLFVRIGGNPYICTVNQMAVSIRSSHPSSTIHSGCATYF